MERAEDALLSALDVPVEVHRNTLSVEGAPLALTLFENKWRWFRNECENFLDWLSGKLTPRLGWSPVRLGLLPLKISADLSRATLDMQLAAQNTISWSTAIKGIGKNFIEEQRRIVDEQKIIAKQNAELEQQGQIAGMLGNVTMSQNPAAAGQPPPPPDAAMGGMPPGGAPPMGGGMSPGAMGMMGMIDAGMSPSEYEKMSPIDVAGLAEHYANMIVSAGPNRRTMLNELRNQLPESLYAAVKKAVERLDNQMRSEGRVMLQQQMGGQPPM